MLVVEWWCGGSGVVVVVDEGCDTDRWCDPNLANPYQTLPVVMPKGHVTLMNSPVSVYPISH